MSPLISPVETHSELPHSTMVVVIGGGIVGLSAALSLAERNIPVVVLEKGTLLGEQSSRNLGWVRKTSRLAEDMPLALAAERLWEEMPQRTGHDVGFRRKGIMFAARTAEQLSTHERWLESVKAFDLDTRILSGEQLAKLVPGGIGSWAGAVYTPSDARAEPTLAGSAIARGAMARGAIIIERCAVRSIVKSAGRVSGVITERGEIRCEHVLLAAGLWSRRFMGNLGLDLPTLPLVASVLKTKAMQGPTEIAVGAPDFSFRKHIDGGYIIMQRGALDAPLTLDHLLTGRRFLPQLRSSRGYLRVGLNRYFLDDLRLARRWSPSAVSPFEKVRTMSPKVNESLNQEAMRNLIGAWPAFAQAQIEQSWAGVIDVTPDSNPVISPISAIPGLTLATGFSGHGFGTSPAAGYLAADLITNTSPIVDPTPYRYSRFA
ncbi:D-amino-acid oxidase [Pseudomonas sp. FDAARGOS_380]|uniref:NAD(P)/FAD-dependent oxidoreductase n=1 Tax=unclassified Pseudomonas TaxID=196821 RepID=UPI000BFCBE46|nr:MULTISPECIES: FAD-binding oxidoreductase [unclassified Pseudomonas]ATN08286.1 D-amino-acid oxidase [Pseudomonas sp. FDAARGOS_380]